MKKLKTHGHIGSLKMKNIKFWEGIRWLTARICINDVINDTNWIKFASLDITAIKTLLSNCQSLNLIKLSPKIYFVICSSQISIKTISGYTEENFDSSYATIFQIKWRKLKQIGEPQTRFPTPIHHYFCNWNWEDSKSFQITSWTNILLNNFILELSQGDMAHIDHDLPFDCFIFSIILSCVYYK